jgi:predicted DNA-binding transcriptional regulator AlpA
MAVFGRYAEGRDVTTTEEDTAAPGRYGRPIGWLEHEIDKWVHDRIRAATGQPAMPPRPPPEHPRIIREKEVHNRTGLSRVHRWRLEQCGRFPRRIYLDDAEESVVTDAAA